MTNKELAEKIRDLYNKGARFPTLQEVEAVLATKDDLVFRWTVECDKTEKDMLLKQVNDVVRTFGVINILDVLAAITPNDVKLMDSAVQQSIKNCADYLAQKAAAQGFSTNTRFIPNGLP